MWDKDEYFKGISFVKIAFLILFFLGAMVMISQVRGNEKKSLMFDTSKYGWPTQLLFDSTNACYQGTYKWIVMSNPILLGSVPPPQTQRAMIEHCFCVLDTIRLQYSYVEYMQMVMNQDKMGNLYYETALTCVTDHGTLQGIIVLEPNDNATVTDNETIIDNSTLKKEEPKEDSTESSPDQSEKEPISDSETIFQG